MIVDLLNEQVLVLNKNFAAIGIIDVREAFKLLYSNKAIVMDTEYNSYSLDDWSFTVTPDTKHTIRSITQEYPVPEVIRLVEFDRTIEKAVAVSRQNIFFRDRFVCQYCKKLLTKNELTIDHVIPKSRRVEFNLTAQQINDWTNMVSSCQACNVKKNNKTPEEANMKLLKKPSKPTSVLKGFEMKKLKPIWGVYIKVEEQDESYLHSI